MPFRSCARWIAAASLLAAFVFATVSTEAGLKKSDAEVKASAEASKTDASGKQTITITLNVNPGWYIYANPVDNEDFASNKTVVTVYADKKPVEAKIEYPKGKAKKTGDFMYSIYDGKVTILAHVTRPADAKSLDLAIRVSTCNEKGICLLPGTIKLNVP